jgi:L-iditol 2-dehydrogenase
MRVVMYYNNKDIRIENMPVPKIGSDELLMRVEASGICGSDVLEWYRLKKAPLVLGHEVAGEVVKVGDQIQKFKKGDHIAASHHVPCNTCYYCLTGHHTCCDTLRITNFDPGGFAEFLRLPAINIVRGTYLLPEGMSYEEATFHEPLGCVIRAQRIAGLKPGQSVLVFGSGIAGLLNINLARASGAGRILAVDPVSYRLNEAKKFGADEAIRPSEDTGACMRQMNGGRLADLILICTGAREAILEAFGAVERGGTVLLFAPTDTETKVHFSVNELFFRNDITITTSYGASPYDSWLALQLIQSSTIKVKEMISHRLSLEETALGFQIVAKARDSLKVIIEPQR